MSVDKLYQRLQTYAINVASGTHAEHSDIPLRTLIRVIMPDLDKVQRRKAVIRFREALAGMEEETGQVDETDMPEIDRLIDELNGQANRLRRDVIAVEVSKLHLLETLKDSGYSLAEYYEKSLMFGIIPTLDDLKMQGATFTRDLPRGWVQSMRKYAGTMQVFKVDNGEGLFINGGNVLDGSSYWRFNAEVIRPIRVVG